MFIGYQIFSCWVKYLDGLLGHLAENGRVEILEYTRTSEYSGQLTEAMSSGLRRLHCMYTTVTPIPNSLLTWSCLVNKRDLVNLNTS